MDYPYCLIDEAIDKLRLFLSNSKNSDNLSAFQHSVLNSCFSMLLRLLESLRYGNI